MNTGKQAIENGKAVLGIELGSTRIKAVLLGEQYETLAVGTSDWENHLENNIWTYPLEEVWSGVQESYASMAKDAAEKYGVTIKTLKSIGFSAMMHGYLPFDKNDRQLTAFRTWRNTMTGDAVKELTDLFQYNVPLRFSIAHLYQAVLNGEPHVKDVSFFTTLAGYVHWKLTGKKELGIGDASGMFPIDIAKGTFNEHMIALFNDLVHQKGILWNLEDLLPDVKKAGEAAGTLTAEGAKLLDPTGNLVPGIPLCPPEGDAGTGMVATNSVAAKTGNVSAGTSIFAMIVLEKELSKVHPEIDMVTTPSGELVAMAHANNCSSDLNAWANIFREFSEEAGIKMDPSKLYGILFNTAMKGDKDCGGVLSYGFLSGENIFPLNAGRPLITRLPDSNFNLSNLMRANISTAFGAVRMGLDILTEQEGVTIDEITGAGGIFKTPGVAQKIMAAAFNTRVSIMETAGEGGAWGMAVLAAFLTDKKDGETLSDFLKNRIFVGQQKTVADPDPEDVRGFNDFMQRYQDGLEIEYAAVEHLKEKES